MAPQENRVLKPVPITLNEVVEEVPGVKSFIFNYDKTSFSYKASQVVRLFIGDGSGESIYHPFSIASSPSEDGLRLTTRIRSESVYKQKLNGLKSGDTLTMMGPGGKFTLPDDASAEVVMLGGGIGITPFRSMIKHATDTNLQHQITLLYSNRTPEGIVYKQEWEEMQKANPRLKVVYTITRPEPSKTKWTGRTGRIDEAFIKGHVKDLQRSLFYVCGTPAMNSAMSALLRSMGVDGGKVMIETFHGYAN